MAALGAAAPGGAVARTPVAHAARVGAVPSGAELQLVLPLRAREAALERRAADLTTPGSPDYGQYESIAQLSKQFGASALTRARVTRFLHAAGATHIRIDSTGLFADATITAGRAQRVFDTPLARFRGTGGARWIAPIGADAASAATRVPAGLRGSVSAVVGLSTRPLEGAHASALNRASAATATSGHGGATIPLAHFSADTGSATDRTGTPSGCASGVGTGGFTPNQYLTAYDFAPLQAADVLGQGERVALIEIDGFKDSDIETFASCFGLGVPAINAFGVGSVRHQLAPGGESTLDLEVLDAAAPALKEIDVYEAHADPAETLQALTAPLHNRGRKPQIVSASLGLCEEEVFSAISSNGVNAAEASLAEASAAGITFLASSGDSGSADCTDRNDLPIHRLSVNYPASSWWVTGVGGTNFLLNPNNTLASQAVWNDADLQPGSAGGGGLSRGFNRPNYQKGTVAANRRAVPDVSMLADIQPGFAIYCSASQDCVDSHNPDPWTTVGGTSAATPLLAGGFALVDQRLQAAGRADLGLVNPLLYKLGRSSERAAVFSDVTIGSNDVFPFAGGKALGCCNAGAGFDEASGWGSVNVTNFAAVAATRQPKLVHFSLTLPKHQQAIAAHKIKATVSCSAACLAGAFSEVRIGGERPFEVDSFVSRLRAAGSKQLTMAFSGRELSALRSARSRGVSIVATVHGVVLDGAVNSVSHDAGVSIRAQTRGKTLRLS
jgi:kumamolisin